MTDLNINEIGKTGPLPGDKLESIGCAYNVVWDGKSGQCTVFMKHVSDGKVVCTATGSTERDCIIRALDEACDKLGYTPPAGSQIEVLEKRVESMSAQVKKQSRLIEKLTGRSDTTKPNKEKDAKDSDKESI